MPEAVVDEAGGSKQMAILQRVIHFEGKVRQVRLAVQGELLGSHVERVAFLHEDVRAGRRHPETLVKPLEFPLAARSELAEMGLLDKRSSAQIEHQQPNSLIHEA
jgi:membrane-anchored protein YejM (alkaline phosphatase superfamily)